jgi:hypothetical protein
MVFIQCNPWIKRSIFALFTFLALSSKASEIMTPTTISLLGVDIKLPEQCVISKPNDKNKHALATCTDSQPASGFLSISITKFDYSVIENVFAEASAEYIAQRRSYVSGNLEVFELRGEYGKNLSTFICDPHQCLYLAGSYQSLLENIKQQVLKTN